MGALALSRKRLPRNGRRWGLSRKRSPGKPGCGAFAGNRFPRNAGGGAFVGEGLLANADGGGLRGRVFLDEARPPADEVASSARMGGHSKTTKRERNRAFVSGLATMGPASASVVVGGKTFVLGALAKKLQAQIALLDAIAVADGKRRALIAEERALEAELRPLLVGLKGVVRNEVGEDAAKLARFALEPKKKTGPKTAEVKAASAVKAKATRKERKTMGRRQKARIKG